MKVKIGPYTNWFGPFQLADFLCFWAKKDEYGRPPDWVHKFGEWLAYGEIEPEQKEGEIRPLFLEKPHTKLSKFLSWIDSKKKRKIKVHIDPYDVWSLDETLSHIILPALKAYRKNICGAPYVDLEDVPEELRPTEEEKKNLEPWDTDSKHFKRWEWVVDEMIFAFEHKLDNSWEEELYPPYTKPLKTLKNDKGYEVIFPEEDKDEKDEKTRLKEERDKIYARIDKGLLLFGKYFQGLWN